MLKRHFIQALRRLGRHRLNTTINILGLTLGILTCLVSYLLVSYEFSYDTFHRGGDRIYRLIAGSKSPEGREFFGAGMTAGLPPALRSELSGLSAVTIFFVDDSRVIIPNGTKQPREFSETRAGDELHHIAFAEPDFFSIFTYQWLAGNPATALNAPSTVVLSEREAQRYFGAGTPAEWLGRTVIYHDSLPVTVSGIVKDWAGNSDFRFTDLLSVSTIDHSFLKNDIDTKGWNMWDYDDQGLVKLAPGVTAAQVEKQFPAFLARHLTQRKGATQQLFLQPLADKHFNAKYADRYSRTAHKPTLYALMAISLFILLLAAINFVNLSTAQAVMRAREVGVRKVLGSSRLGLAGQFLRETLVIVIAATGLALLLADPVIAALHNFIPREVHLDLFQPLTIGFILVTITVTCLLAGWYPAKMLSSFAPVESLRGKGIRQLNSSSYLRKGLIVFQFTISLLFIIGTIVVGRQMHYMLNSDLGFDKDAIITFDLPRGQPVNKKRVLAAEMGRIPGVQLVSVATSSPESKGHPGTGIEYDGAATIKVDASFDQCDTNYISLYGLTLIAGRNIFPADSSREFILNETCAKALGFRRPADALGIEISSGLGGEKGPVIGIVKDFHYADYHKAIEPFFLTASRTAGNLLSVKLGAGDRTPAQVKDLLGKMEKMWTAVYPTTKFNYRFFDESIARLYEHEQRTAQIMNLSMAIAIFISCMGLFGLAAFTATQRTKEIGIRKVLGAGVPQLVSLLSGDFVRLVLLSVIIAGPVAGWAMHEWLQDFAYRTTIPWWIYLLAGVAAIAIALLTVSFQAIRAATANPVESLRSE